jgi:hypothetical protein
MLARGASNARPRSEHKLVAAGYGSLLAHGGNLGTPIAKGTPDDATTRLILCLPHNKILATSASGCQDHRPLITTVKFEA